MKEVEIINRLPDSSDNSFAFWVLWAKQKTAVNSQNKS
jgi:hypothetical protein